MDQDQFIGAVATRCGASAEQAAAVTRATLTTLAERIDGGEARDLADQLPEALRAYAFGPAEAAEAFGLDEFVARVGGRADVDAAAARDGVTAVFDVLRDAVDPAAYAQAVAQLPASYGDLVDRSASAVRRAPR